MFCFCRFLKPGNRLFLISGSMFQPELSQCILGIHISELCGPFPVCFRCSVILSRTGSCMQHLPQAVLQLVIMALRFQSAETGKCLFKATFRIFRVNGNSNSVPVHLCHFITGIGISLLCGLLIQVKCLTVVLCDSLPPVIETSK